MGRRSAGFPARARQLTSEADWKAKLESDNREAHRCGDSRRAHVPRRGSRRHRHGRVLGRAAAHRITRKPYKWGGGHGRWWDSGYDCSGAVSYVLYKAGLLDGSRDSTGFMSYGERRRGAWITIYANGGHAYMEIAGLRFDTSGRGEEGPRWRPEWRSGRGFVKRHPVGL